MDLPDLGVKPGSPTLQADSWPSEPPWKPCLDHKWTEVKVVQSCPALCDPTYCSLPGSSAHGILQARILEWVAVSFSGESSQTRDRTQVSCITGRCFTVWATREALEYKRYLILIKMGRIKWRSKLVSQITSYSRAKENLPFGVLWLFHDA